MAQNNQIQGEGNYDAGRRYQQEQHEFAKQSGKAEKAAHEAEEALDGAEGQDLERARRETGKDQM